MSAMPATALSCDAHVDDAWCPRRIVLVGDTAAVRVMAAANGWRTDGDRDWCADHAGTARGGQW